MATFVQVYSGTLITVNSNADRDALDTSTLTTGTIVRVMGAVTTSPVIAYRETACYILDGEGAWQPYEVPPRMETFTAIAADVTILTEDAAS